MERERVYLKLLGKKILSYKILEDGTIEGTGILNPILDRIRLFRILVMMILQAGFYDKYKDLGRWKGMRVSNPFAPPVGSKPQIRALKGLVKKEFLKKPTPLAMTFAVTYRCQLNCIHCSAANHFKPGTPELSTEEAKNLIDQAEDLGVTVIAFTGGEPLIRKDISDLIGHVDQDKAIPIMFTNALLIDEEKADELAEAGLYTIFISIDSPVPEEHDSFRGLPGLFQRAVDAIELMKSRGVFVGISSYATRSGTEKGYYKRLYDFAREIGVDDVILFDAVPTGSLLHDTSEVLTPEQRIEIMEYSEKIFEKSIIPPLSSQSWQNSVEGYLSGIGCLAANIQFYASAYGDIAPCDFTPLSFGNIREEPLGDIWKRMTNHPAYNHRVSYCRMQNSRFRKCYIDPIPPGATLPYPIDELPAVDYRQCKLDENSKEKTESKQKVGQEKKPDSVVLNND